MKMFVEKKGRREDVHVTDTSSFFHISGGGAVVAVGVGWSGGSVWFRVGIASWGLQQILPLSFLFI